MSWLWKPKVKTVSCNSPNILAEGRSRCWRWFEDKVNFVWPVVSWYQQSSGLISPPFHWIEYFTEVTDAHSVGVNGSMGDFA